MKKTDTRKQLNSYLIGLVLSLSITLLAYLLVRLSLDSGDLANKSILIGSLVGLAITQLAVQLIFFLHLGREPKPRLNVMAFLFMVMVVLIIGLGSIWIMRNLDYNMTPHEVETFIKEEEQIDTTESHMDSNPH